MKYLFDTNICIYLLGRRDAALLKKASRLAPGSVAVSALTVAELAAGIAIRSTAHEDMGVLTEFLSSFQIIPFDLSDADAYPTVYWNQDRSGKKAHLIDTLLAAQALARDLSIVTNDVRHFRQIPSIRVENWVR